MSVYQENAANGQSYWRVDVTWEHPDGRIQRVRKVSPINTKRGAEQYERDIRNALADGTYGKRKGEDIPTLADFEDRYFKQHVAKLPKASTRDGYRAIFEHHLVPKLGKLRLNAITTDALDQLAADIIASGRKPKTVNNVLSCMKTALDMAATWGVIQASEVPEIHWMKVDQQGFDFLSFEELPLLLAAAWAGPVLFGSMIQFATHTGMRQGELLAVRKRDIDRRNWLVRVERSAWKGIEGGTKNTKVRHIPLNACAVEAIERLPESSSEYLFPGADGGKLTKGECKWPLWGACDRAGIGRRIGWHVLRHTFASHLAMRSVPITAIQKALGHSTINMTLRYAHLSPEFLRDAVDALALPPPAIPPKPEVLAARKFDAAEDEEDEE